MSCETCISKTDDAVKAGRIMADMVQAYDNQNRRLWAIIIALMLCLAIMTGCMIWAVQNVQKVANEAVLTALETAAEMEVVSETTTTTTTEIIQDTGEGSGNNVYLDGDGTTYNEGGGGS